MESESREYNELKIHIKRRVLGVKGEEGGCFPKTRYVHLHKVWGRLELPCAI